MTDCSTEDVECSSFPIPFPSVPSVVEMGWGTPCAHSGFHGETVVESINAILGRRICCPSRNGEPEGQAPFCPAPYVQINTTQLGFQQLALAEESIHARDGALSRPQSTGKNVTL